MGGVYRTWTVCALGCGRRVQGRALRRRLFFRLLLLTMMANGRPLVIKQTLLTVYEALQNVNVRQYSPPPTTTVHNDRRLPSMGCISLHTSTPHSQELVTADLSSFLFFRFSARSPFHSSRALAAIPSSSYYPWPVAWAHTP
jgi:hypothetical protein